MRAQARQPIDDDGAHEREQREGAERGGRDRVLPAEARASHERNRKDLDRQHDRCSRRGERIPAAEGEHREQGQRQRERNAARHRRDKRVMAFGQRDEASEALGQPQRADC